MNLAYTVSELSTLPIAQRLQIIHMLWESIPADSEIPLSQEQQAELSRRKIAHQANPSSAISEEELMRRLKDR